MEWANFPAAKWTPCGITLGNGDTKWNDTDVVKLVQAIESGHLRLLGALDLSGSTGIAGKSLVSLAAALGKGYVCGLRELLLGGIAWGDDGVVELAKAIESGNFSSLGKLDLSGSIGVTGKSLERLTAALDTRYVPHLREFVGGGIGWGDDGVVRLAMAIESKKLPALEVLDISGSTGITGKSLVRLATALGNGHLHHLRELILGGTGWGDDGVFKLAEGIESGKFSCLQKLDLADSPGVTEKSWVGLTVALAKRPVFNLRELVVSDVKFGNDGIVLLAKAIESGKLMCLETLDVSETKLCREEFLADLATSIGTGNMKNLKRLIFRNTGLGNEGAYKLGEAVHSGKLPSLETLEITGNPKISESTKVLLLALTAGHVPRLLVDEPRLIPKHLGTPVLKADGLKVSSPDRETVVEQDKNTQNTRNSELPSTPSMQKDDSLYADFKTDTPWLARGRAQGWARRSAWGSDTKMEKQGPDHEDHAYHQGDIAFQEDSPRQGEWCPGFHMPSSSKDHGHLSYEGDDMKKSQGGSENGVEYKANVAGNEFRFRSTKEEFQFRLDIQRLGFRSWDDKCDPGCTLVLGDVTSSAEQLYFVFFHMEAMIRLFGCGLPCSKVTILLDKRLIWIQELTEESWKAFWISSYQGFLRPFLLEETKIGHEDNVERSEPGLFHLTKNEALSKFGVSIDGPELQQFTKLSRPTAARADGKINWQPTWMSWLKTVINHVFPDGSTPRQLRKRMEDLHIISTSGTETRHKGQEGVADETAQGATPSLQQEADGGAEQERKSLVVLVSFNCAAWPFFEYTSDRESAEEITDNRDILPKRISYIHPQLKVEFFRMEEEKCVTTSLEVKYQMKCQDGWPCGWFQNDLRLSFRSSEPEGFLKNHGIKGSKFIQTDTTSQCGGSSSNHRGVSMEGGGQGNITVVSANGKISRQDKSTAQTTWSDQNKYTQRRRVLESEEFFGVSDNSYESTMEGQAVFWPVQNPSLYYCRQPEHRFDQSGLRAEVSVGAEADWELSGRHTHVYFFEASKELTKCTKAEQQNDGERPRKWLKMFSGESSRPLSDLQDQNVAKVRQDKLLQIFRKRFFLNHDFDQFFERYKKSGAYKWKIIDKSPVDEALADERSIPGKNPP